MAEEKTTKEAKPKAEAAPKKNGRKPSALKRDLQSEKRNLKNRSFKSKVHTTLVSLENSLAKKDSPETIRTSLSNLFSLMDKGVKKGIFKQRKADRAKARFFAKAKSLSVSQ